MDRVQKLQDADKNPRNTPPKCFSRYSATRTSHFKAKFFQLCQISSYTYTSYETLETCSAYDKILLIGESTVYLDEEGNEVIITYSVLDRLHEILIRLKKNQIRKLQEICKTGTRKKKSHCKL